MRKFGHDFAKYRAGLRVRKEKGTNYSTRIEIFEISNFMRSFQLKLLLYFVNIFEIGGQKFRNQRDIKMRKFERDFFVKVSRKKEKKKKK